MGCLILVLVPLFSMFSVTSSKVSWVNSSSFKKSNYLTICFQASDTSQGAFLTVHSDKYFLQQCDEVWFLLSRPLSIYVYLERALCQIRIRSSLWEGGEANHWANKYIQSPLPLHPLPLCAQNDFGGGNWVHTAHWKATETMKLARMS